MPRGRPRKVDTVEKVKKKKVPPSHQAVGELKKNDKPVPPKKRGRKKKNQELLLKPEEVLDYLDRNYPNLGIDKIRESVIEGLKNRDQNAEKAYVLDEIIIAGETYYCDTEGNIMNDDVQLCGYIIDSDADSGSEDGEIHDADIKTHSKGKTQDSKSVRVQMFYAQTDNRTFKQVMDAIRSDNGDGDGDGSNTEISSETE